MIHETAIIDSGARLDDSVSVGPYSVIGPDVEIAPGTEIGSHVVIKGPVRIGTGNIIYHFCSIGEDPQDKKFTGEKDSLLEIGDNNVIREYCSINRGTEHGGGITKLGNDNWIMAYVHIAHDCMIGNHNTFANNATLAGHVIIDDYVTLGGFTGIHQFCRLGSYSFCAISSVVVKDIPPFVMAAGNTAKPCGLNREGLKRHGFSHDDISNLRQAYKLLYRDGLLLNEAIRQLSLLADSNREIHKFVGFIKESQRGIIR